MSACWPRNTTPRPERQVGNFPQAFSHVALVNTALNLSRTPEAGRAALREYCRMIRTAAPPCYFDQVEDEPPTRL